MAQNRALQDQLRAAEDRIADLTAAGADPSPRPTPSEDPFRALAVRFADPTGPVDEDGEAGPEGLHVVLQPLDAETDVVKRAGRLRLEILAPPADGQDTGDGGDAAGQATPLHVWTFSQEETAEAWVDSLGVRGYVLTLPWPAGAPSAADAMRLRAAFTTRRGETLEAERRLAPPPE
jgi:hypothetical protein